MIYFLKFKETPFIICSQQTKKSKFHLFKPYLFFVSTTLWDPQFANPQSKPDTGNRKPEGRALFIYPLQGSSRSEILGLGV